MVTPVQSHLMTPSFVALNLAPIGAAMAGTLAAGNAVYLYLPVGFIQVLLHEYCIVFYCSALLSYSYLYLPVGFIRVHHSYNYTSSVL